MESSVDFQSLKRRELQALCKKNKIPANMANLAMANALQSLPTVEGLDEFLEHRETEVAESPEKSAMTTPIVLRCSSTRQRTATKQEPDGSKPARGGSTRKTVAFRETDGAKKGASSKTQTAAPSTKTKEKGAVTHVYSSRRSTRLLDRKMRDLSLEEKEVMQREFVENLQNTEVSDGCPQLGGLSAGGELKAEFEISLVSKDSKGASCDKLDKLEEKDKELQAYALEKKVDSLSLEESHNVTSVTNDDGAEDAIRDIICKSKLLVHPETESLMLFSKLDVMLKSKEDPNVILEEEQNVMDVMHGAEAEDANSDNEFKRGELLHDSKEAHDVFHEPTLEKEDDSCEVPTMFHAGITCNEPDGDKQKGNDDVLGGSTTFILKHGITSNEKASVEGAYSEKLESAGVKANVDVDQTEDEEDPIAVADPGDVCELNQPFGAHRSDAVEGGSDVIVDVDIADSVEGGIVKELKKVESGLETIEVEDSSSVVTEEIDIKDPVDNTGAFNVEEEVESGLKGNEVADPREHESITSDKDSLASQEATGENSIVPPAENAGFVAWPSAENLLERSASEEQEPGWTLGNQESMKVDDQKENLDQVVSNIVDEVANLSPITKAELPVDLVVADIYSQEIESGFSLAQTEKLATVIDNTEACPSPFNQTTPARNLSSGNLQVELDSIVQDTISPCKSPSNKSSSARKMMTQILNDNKENIVISDTVPGVTKIASMESGTLLKEKSLRQLKKEIKQQLEEKRQREVLKSVSANCLIAGGLNKEN